ncbi:MAG: UDP-N-acetylglucosamine 2-epimerase, partial [Clostridiales bacterium]
EMFAAVISGIPYGIKFAHLHGGEKTLGAIDNIFRHSITLASVLHFVSCEEHAARVQKLIESSENIYNVGALSLDNLHGIEIYSVEEFNEKYSVDISEPTILVTLHPETVSYENNLNYVDVVCSVIHDVIKDFRFIVTLPNSDTAGNIIRERFLELQESNEDRIKCFESLGSRGYFSAMNYCAFLLGNTSSGIIEAASFNKWVINLGDRQRGRIHGANVFDIPFEKDMIKGAISRIMENPKFEGENLFYKGKAAENVILLLKKYERLYK